MLGRATQIFGQVAFALFSLLHFFHPLLVFPIEENETFLNRWNLNHQNLTWICIDLTDDPTSQAHREGWDISEESAEIFGSKIFDMSLLQLATRERLLLEEQLRRFFRIWTSKAIIGGVALSFRSTLPNSSQIEIFLHFSSHFLCICVLIPSRLRWYFSFKKKEFCSFDPALFVFEQVVEEEREGGRNDQFNYSSWWCSNELYLSKGVDSNGLKLKTSGTHHHLCFSLE